MRKCLMFSLVLAAVFCLAACGQRISSEADTASVAERKVGIIMPASSPERWERDGRLLEEEFKKAGYGTVIRYSGGDIDRQISDIRSMISEKALLLVIAPIDGASLDDVMSEAGTAKIPVIAYDRFIRSDDVSCYISFDSYAAGRLQGEYIESKLGLDKGKGPYTVEFTAGDPSDGSAMFCFDGAYDVLGKYIDSGMLISLSHCTDFASAATGSCRTDMAYARAENILASYYADGADLSAWFCSDDPLSIGVSQALQSDYKGSGFPLVTGQGGYEESLKNIVDGYQAMTVYKPSSEEAALTAYIGSRLIEGAAADGSLIQGADFAFDCGYNDSDYETSEGRGCPSYLLAPEAITKENMKRKLVDTGYFTKDGDYLKEQP